MIAQLPTPSSARVSAQMSKQRRRDTTPEVSIRKLLHARGLRYRVAWPIPGMRRRTIDIAFTRARVAAFIDGCFWHSCPQHATRPVANKDWWSTKLEANRMRDVATTLHLEMMGWHVVRIWEHQSPDEAAAHIIEQVRKRVGVSESTANNALDLLYLDGKTAQSRP